MKDNKHQKWKNGAADYVGSYLKVHNPLFSVGEMWRNKLMERVYWSIKINMLGMLLNVEHRQVHKNI